MRSLKLCLQRSEDTIKWWTICAKAFRVEKLLSVSVWIELLRWKVYLFALRLRYCRRQFSWLKRGVKEKFFSALRQNRWDLWTGDECLKIPSFLGIILSVSLFCTIKSTHIIFVFLPHFLFLLLSTNRKEIIFLFLFIIHVYTRKSESLCEDCTFKFIS